jgi:hypothetical protein
VTARFRASLKDCVDAASKALWTDEALMDAKDAELTEATEATLEAAEARDARDTVETDPMDSRETEETEALETEAVIAARLAKELVERTELMLCTKLDSVVNPAAPRMST